MGSSDEQKKRLGYKYKKYKAKYYQNKNNQVGGNSDPLSKWRFAAPKEEYSRLIKKYGLPNYINNEADGVAVWRDNNDNIKPHKKIMLKDEYVAHSKPQQHYDYLYSVIKIYIPPDRLVDVIKVSGSITYDPLKKYLRARCANIEANFATFRTVIDVINRRDTSYNTNIVNKDKEIPDNEKYVTEYIKFNNEQYSQELALPYYPLEAV